MAGKELFISGIDTDCGKTYITGLLAYQLKKQGVNLITAKQIQTGCKGISEDILEHRRIMESELYEEDKSGLTCPFVLSFPASPHLAAQIDKVAIDMQVIRDAGLQLLQKYDVVITEGAGGLMVPLIEGYHTLDYLKAHKIPLVLVSSSKLGSINHTLLSLSVCKQYGINLSAFIYNFLPGCDKTIAESSLALFRNFLSNEFPNTVIFTSEMLQKDYGDADLSVFF